MSGESIGWGAEFWLDNSSDVLTQILGVYNVSPPNPQTDEVEVTHYQSPDRQREYIAGLIENGECTVEMNYIAGSASDLLLTEAQTSGEVRDARIIVPTTEAPNGWGFSFRVIVKGYEKGIPVDDRQTATLTLKVAGAVTEAAEA